MKNVLYIRREQTIVGYSIRCITFTTHNFFFRWCLLPLKRTHSAFVYKYNNILEEKVNILRALKVDRVYAKGAHIKIQQPST